MPKAVTITPEVHAVLAAATVLGTTERPVVALNQPDLPRDLYSQVDKVLKALGGKWNRAAGGHVFDRPVEGELAAALASGKAVDQRRTAEQFFTPEHIAMSMAVRAGIADGTHVLEPSAGAGALVAAAIAYGGTVTAIEKDPLLISQLSRSGDGRFGHLRVYHDDFMGWTRPSGEEVIDCVAFSRDFDVVMMNPPFSRDQDMLHVDRALQLVRPGGKVVAIMSPHWTFAESSLAQAFRGYVNLHSHEWTPLPTGSFRSSGTDVNTGILSITKGNI